MPLHYMYLSLQDFIQCVHLSSCKVRKQYVNYISLPFVAHATSEMGRPNDRLLNTGNNSSQPSLNVTIAGAYKAAILDTIPVIAVKL